MRTEPRRNRTFATPAVLSIMLVAGCQNSYLRPLEVVDAEAANPLVDRMIGARNSQANARAQFDSVLANFRAVAATDGTDLDAAYFKLSANYRAGAARAQSVRQRIARLQASADDTFAAWQEDLETYTDASARRDREQWLAATRTCYEDVVAAMTSAERAMEPVLEALREQVGIFRRSPGRDDVQALRAEIDTIERNTSDLITELEQAIGATDAFLASLEVRREPSTRES